MKKLIGILGIAILVLGIFAGYRAGIRHAMTECVVSVYLDGRVEMFLDGDIWEHKAF